MRPAYGFPECSWIPGMYLTGYLQAKDTYHLEKVHLSDKLYKQGAGTLKQRCLLLINLGSLSIVGVGFVKIPPQFYEKGPFYV